MSESAEKNRAFFSNEASTYNSKHEKVINQIIAEIQARKDWIGVEWADDASSDNDDEAADDGSTSKPPRRSVRLLDYACGTGLVSRALSPYVTQCIGIDISENMVQEYNLSASNQGIPASEMQAYTGNLLLPPSTSLAPPPFPSPQFHNFDIAVVGMGFHHFDDPRLATARLAERLRPGGVLLIVDFLPHERHSSEMHAAAHTVMHAGFAEEKVKGMFVEAGVGLGFEYVSVGKGVVFVNKGEDMKRSVFMARGVKSVGGE